MSTPLTWLVALLLLALAAPAQSQTGPPASGDRWSTDVRIGNRDSIGVVDLDVHLATGNLFAVLLRESGAGNGLLINHSTDGGATWAETWDILVGSCHDISCAVLGDHCYVAFEWGASGVYVRRYKVSDGSADTLPNGQSYTQVYSGSIKELELVSEQDFGGNELHLVIMEASGNLSAFRSTSAAGSWSGPHLFRSGADRGLSVALAGNSFQPSLAISFLTPADVLEIGLYLPGFNIYVTALLEAAGAYGVFTDISAYGDTIVCAHEKGASYVSIVYSINGGNNWATHNVDGTSEIFMFPAVTCRNGGGIGVVYMYEEISWHYGQFKWRPYNDPQFYSKPRTRYTDWEIEPYTQPDIEYLGGGKFGIVYVNEYVRNAWFDYGSQCCNHDGIRGNADYVTGPAGEVDVADLTFIVGYLFQGGSAPVCVPEGNVDGLDGPGGPIDVADLTYLVAYLFQAGPAPAACP